MGYDFDLDYFYYLREWFWKFDLMERDINSNNRDLNPDLANKQQTKTQDACIKAAEFDWNILHTVLLVKNDRWYIYVGIFANRLSIDL